MRSTTESDKDWGKESDKERVVPPNTKVTENGDTLFIGDVGEEVQSNKEAKEGSDDIVVTNLG